jgi:hypothetical protein
MLGELRPEEPLDEGEEGIDGEEGIEEDCCCCGQPPIRNAQTAPTAVACAATMGRDLRERLICIVSPRSPAAGHRRQRRHLTLRRVS